MSKMYKAGNHNGFALWWNLKGDTLQLEAESKAATYSGDVIYLSTTGKDVLKNMRHSENRMKALLNNRKDAIEAIEDNYG